MRKHDFSDEDLHQHLRASVGKWDPGEAMLSKTQAAILTKIQNPNKNMFIPLRFFQSLTKFVSIHPMKVALSRFFDWPAKWRKFSRMWGFMKQVYKQWQLMKGEQRGNAADAADQGEDDGAGGAQVEEGDENIPDGFDEAGDAVFSQRKSQTQHEKLMKSLKEMQKSRHTLDIVKDVLWDDRVKVYAHMCLDFISTKILTMGTQANFVT